MGDYDLRKKYPLVVKHCDDVYKFKTHFVNFKEMTDIISNKAKKRMVTLDNFI